MCSQTIDVKFRDISYAIQTGFRRPKKQILKGLSGFFRSTELTAIMGPSGAGKSTLLNILSGFQEGLYTGTVEYFSRGNKQNRDTFKKQLRYIQQMDSLHGYFTTQEIMMIASYLKISKSISHKSRQMLIDGILNTLTLSHTKDTRVDRLSGGQKKRLSIALELIDNPMLIFLDEPTTGLDSLASVQCVTALKTLAQTGRTIICTIHQPSATLYEMFDHIYLVVDGHCMYRFPPSDTVDFFAQQGLVCPKYHNPADYMLEVVSKEYGNYDEQLIAATKCFAESNDETRWIKSSHDMSQDISNDNQTITPPTELNRFWVLLSRYATLMYRDHVTIHLKLIMHFLVGVLLGLLYEHAGDDGKKIFSNLTYFQVSLVYLYYTTMMPAVLKFPLEVTILRKECFNNWYKLKTYYTAMLVSTIPIQMVSTFIYTFISYLLSSQPLEFSRFFMYLLICILTVSVSESMGLWLGSIFNPVNGTFFGAIIVCIMIGFAGVLALFKDLSKFMYYLSYLNTFRYSFDGLVQSVYGNGREVLQCSIIYCHLRAPNIILEMLDLAKPLFWLDVVVLIGCSIMFRVLAYVLLKRRLSKMY
ncbi:ATP-binding cassette sub-family G member 4-like [Odontomachus brunneus]|uniref:ATP-binding cassette sub-family G member 4-like n=1 Tax=Odontomachus brunneus TaxID=486640 RepID=UPI0013F26570|nr:ATP-binding cassette sub-family G member 4-like [Odontomachus brunneus]